jgi:histidyl-tRNA synthetase
MKYGAVKGVQDIFPPEVYTWQKAEAAARETFSACGFQELRPPIIESTSVFTRSIGETTDIVEKEMYTFEDKAGRSITLRPEGTAPAVRCYVERRLYNLPSPQKFFYMGPMFRYERPQKGRQRQFYQIGVEAFGVAEPRMDAEVISMLMLFLGRVGMKGLSVEVNSIGCPECRPRYREALLAFFEGKLGSLCPDCQRRYAQNPMRILDCKVPECIAERKGAPVVSDYLCEGCRAHFSELKGLLEALGVPFVENPEMVRGLDYYTRTTFEVKSGELGAQNAVAAGGRYDLLVEEFGGPRTPAVGFAVGMERLVALMGQAEVPAPAVFLASMGGEASREALRLAGKFRESGIWAELGYEGASLKSQMRRADRLKAGLVFIIGEEEIRKGTASWKDLSDGTTGETGLEDIYFFYKQKREQI